MTIATTAVRRNLRERGATILLFTMLMAFIVLPLVGLAIDGSIIFWGKAKLSAAVDAAALAAGRYVSAQSTAGQNQSTATTIGGEWFGANFPNGWMGSTVQNFSATYVQTSSSTQQVTTSATVSIPLYFMRLIGQNSATLYASAQSSRRSTFVVLVLDRSGSMGSPPVGTNACPTMQQDAVNFVNMFSEGFDTMALVTYSTTAGPNPDIAPTQTFKSSMTTTINSLACTGATSTAQALAIAYNAIKSNQYAQGLNVIVLFTDGQPNELVATYPIKTGTDTRYGMYPNYSPWPQYGYPYANYPYTSLFSFGASPCTSSNAISGGISTLVDGNNIHAPAVQGMTGGIWDTSYQVAVNTSPGQVSAPGCNFLQYDSTWVRTDIASIPTTDNYGNVTNGGYSGNSPYYGPNVGTVNVPATFTSGPYNGQIRVDEQTTGIMAAAINAADYQAQVIRSDATYNPVIYTIGLGGAQDMPIDSVLLERIANDPRSPIYTTGQKTGLYVAAPTTSQLNQAFQLVAGQILRLSQ